MEEKWLLLDLETTGLYPHKDVILEVAAFPLDKETLETAEPFAAVVSWPERVLNRKLNDFTRKMHTDSGLLAEVSKAPCVNVDMALYTFLLYNMEDPDKEKWVLVGNSIHFDHGFIEHHWPATHSLLGYRHVDVSGLLTMHRAWTGPVDKGDVAHRAIDDCRQSLDLLKKMREAHFAP